MGGDYAPGEIVAGALWAHRELGVEVVLVGPEAEVEGALADAGSAPAPGLEVLDASDVIPMDDADPARSVRSRRESSISVAGRLVRQGGADAVFSAGPTGATLAAAVLEVGRIRGFSRPAIAVLLPFGDAATVLLDAGANVDARPEHLVGFARLGSAFAQANMGLAEPRVGLLTVGEEAGKGSELVKQTYPLLAEDPGLCFVGNVEGRDVSSGTVDVVVTDGFTGNVCLKLMEGFARFLMGQVMDIVTTSGHRGADGALMPALEDLDRRMDPQSYGGAHLLGVKGVCIIGHGSSNARAVRAALEVSVRAVEDGIIERTTRAFGRQESKGTE